MIIYEFVLAGGDFVSKHEHMHEHEHKHGCGDGCCCHALDDLGHDHEHSNEHCHRHGGMFAFLGEKGDYIRLVLGALIFLGVIIFKAVSGTEEYNSVSLILFIAAYIILGGDVVIRAVKKIFRGEIFDENFLMSIATIGAFIIGEYPEAVGVMLFFNIGEMFEDIAVSRSKSEIMKAVDMRPETVNLISAGGDVAQVRAEEAKVGDIILIRPGDRIPLDGKIIEGESRIDTSPITGEPVPVGVKAGDELLSGCINENGVIKVSVTNPLETSMVSKILDSVQNAAANKPRIDAFITRFARIYTPIVVGIAIITAVVIPLVTRQAFYPWIYTALSFLVMSCPCALVLSVPLAFFCSIGAGSKRGILFKGGSAMEALAAVKSVAMDKTGTLTKGTFEVENIITADGISSDELLALCAACETRSTHPIAVSIVAAAARRGLSISAAEEVSEFSGKGIRAVADGKTVLCGSPRLLKEYGVEHSEVRTAGTAVYVAADGEYIGAVVISDELKSDAADAVKALKAAGICTAMLTGDSERTANIIAESAGIDEVHSRLMPDQKLSELQSIREKHGRTMFVGDGINDAPVLAGADVGAAMGSGADAAIEAADVVFMNSSVSAIPAAIKIAKRATAIARENVVFALAIKIAVMILGLSGIYSNMWLAVFADTGVAFLCILNSIRVRLGK